MANHLQNTVSTYLQQHQDQPVNWYPWGEDAFLKARSQDKPILLSIGYAACHWCHVMAEESFEDVATARFLNEHFVCVKVDRQERPDIDHLFQNVHMLLTRRGGGWPLTVFLDPDGRPFFAGTYFPKEARFGLAGFQDVLDAVLHYFQENRGSIEPLAAQLQSALQNTATTTIGEDLLVKAPEKILPMLDKKWGGTEGAPKFPQAPLLSYLLSSDVPVLVKHASDTLNRLGASGLYDHLGGGFFRYCVDEHWHIPHFEKMLYDQGLLLGLYGTLEKEGALACPWVIDETIDFLEREMQTKEGGFIGALDADSQGVEGAYYLWPQKELENALTAAELALLLSLVRADEPLHIASTDVKRFFALREQLKPIFAKLFQVREKRVRPSSDDLCLTAWNGLVITGLLSAYQSGQRKKARALAESALDFVKKQLFDNGCLAHGIKDGKRAGPAFLDDYAYLLEAALAYFVLTGRYADLQFCLQLADAMIDTFSFEDQLHYSGKSHEKLFASLTPIFDEAVPSPLAKAAEVLLDLGMVLGDARYLELGKKNLERVLQQGQHALAALPGALKALQKLGHPSPILIVTGPKDASWQRLDQQVTVIHLQEQALWPGHLDKPIGDQTRAWLCTMDACQGPFESPEDLKEPL